MRLLQYSLFLYRVMTVACVALGLTALVVAIIWGGGVRWAMAALALIGALASEYERRRLATNPTALARARALDEAL